MNDLEMLAAVMVVLAALGWAAAGLGWIDGSLTVKVIPPSKRPQKPEPEDKPETAAGPVEEPVPLHGEAAA